MQRIVIPSSRPIVSVISSLAAKLSAILFAVATLAPGGLAADYYVGPDGNDSWSGTFVRPFRSITKAMTIVGNYDTIYVKYGRYSHRANSVNNGAGESFPLRSTAYGVQVIGLSSTDGSSFPTITAHDIDATPTDYAGWTQTYKYLMVVRDGWRVRNINFNNKDFVKVGSSDVMVIGLGALDIGLRSASLSATSPVTISNCTFDDNYAGVHIHDTQLSSASYYNGRVVSIETTQFLNHGPILGTTIDKGNQAIWAATWQNLTVNAEVCYFENNHNAIECGSLVPFLTNINVHSGTINRGENGINVTAGVVRVTATSFNRNEAKGQQFGGTANGPTVALGTSGANVYGPNPLDLKVRTSSFLDNQLGVKFSDLGAGSSVAFDLGTTSDPGYNMFSLNPTTPWVAPFVPYATLDNISYVNVWQASSQIDINAIGNLWTYRSTGACVSTAAGQDYNQGVCVNLSDPNDPSNGTFDCYSTKEFTDPSGSDGLNVDANGVANKRPLVTGTAEQTCTANAPPVYYNFPFNFSISNGGRKIVVK